MAPILLEHAPDLLIVQGDTSSALGGALAAASASVPIAHVEAGLRTHDPSLPWPEEEYRTAIDAIAELLFAPTEVSAANLETEKVSGEIHVTGNTAVDAVLDAIALLPPPAVRGMVPRIVVTCHRRESWRDGLESIAAAVGDLAAEGIARFEFVLHPNVHVAEHLRQMLVDKPGVTLIDPLSHFELLKLMRDADLVLSDSGGIQEEAPALGLPLLVLRDKTERPEGVAAGCARLIGTDRDRIVAEVRSLLSDRARLADMSRPSFPYGDGRAAQRISSIIQGWFEQKALTRLLA